MIEIDGSMGEGGGQILRSALSLSMVTGQPFRIERIRANRQKPGLMRQHLTAVTSARRVCRGHVEGAQLGATSLVFSPGEVVPGEYAFAIGTAGSTTLVLQTLLPALVSTGEASTVVLEGGTHNIHAPSVHYLERTFAPLLERMGVSVDVRLERHGFYPAGGGRVRVEISPGSLRPLDLLTRGEITHRRAVALVAGLPPSIATRELGVIGEKLGWDEDLLQIRQLRDGVGPGNVLSIEVGDATHIEVFTGFGKKGTSAEEVAADVAAEVCAYLETDAPVGPYLADQVMLPMALAGRGRYRTGPLSRHAETNARVIETFMGVHVRAEVDGRVTTVSVEPA